MNCPKCGKLLRMQVSLFLDMPSDLQGQLSKKALRTKAVQILGAGWPSAYYYCSCGWVLNLASKGKGR